MNVFDVLFEKLPFCSIVGALAGVVVGTLLGLSVAALPGGTPSLGDIVATAVVLGLLGWFAIILVFGVWLRYGIAQIAPPALPNALLTALLTVWINFSIRMPAIAVPIGMLAGILVGLALCRFCRPVSKGSGRLTNG
jgi:hypothetical protein